MKSNMMKTLMGATLASALVPALLMVSRADDAGKTSAPNTQATVPASPDKSVVSTPEKTVATSGDAETQKPPVEDDRVPEDDPCYQDGDRFIDCLNGDPDAQTVRTPETVRAPEDNPHFRHDDRFIDNIYGDPSMVTPEVDDDTETGATQQPIPDSDTKRPVTDLPTPAVTVPTKQISNTASGVSATEPTQAESETNMEEPSADDDDSGGDGE